MNGRSWLILFCLLIFFGACPAICIAQSFEDSSQDPAKQIVAVIYDQEIDASQLSVPEEALNRPDRGLTDEQKEEYKKAYQKGLITSFILDPLFDRYFSAQNLEVTDEDILGFVRNMGNAMKNNMEGWSQQKQALQQKLSQEGLLDDEKKILQDEIALLDRMIGEYSSRPADVQNIESVPDHQKNLARQFILTWKMNKSLFDQYGGRVIFQQAGPEPLDAYKQFLKEKEAAGDFKILDPALSDLFWDYFINDQIHTFYPPGEGEKFMQTPWWLIQQE